MSKLTIIYIDNIENIFVAGGAHWVFAQMTVFISQMIAKDQCPGGVSVRVSI